MGGRAIPRGGAKRPSAETFSGRWVDRPLGVIDVGSNSARLVIYRSAPVGPPWSIHESKDYPRLVEGVEADGRLSRPARARALAALVRFRRVLDEYGVVQVQAVATSAVREASNGREFLREVSRRCGIRLRSLSGEEEARFAYLGVASSLPLTENLIIDLGGGSLESISVQEGKLYRSLSLPLGALRLHQRFLRHDPPRIRELDALQNHVDDALEPLDELKVSRRAHVVGSGGTTRALAHTLQGMRDYPIHRVHGFTVRTREVERLYSFLSEQPLETRKEVPGLSADRADIIVAGLAVVLGVLHRRKAETLTISGCGIREGIAHEAMGRPLPASAREMGFSGALAALWALRGDPSHAHRVRSVALDLFDRTVRRHWLGEEERLALEVAALLHDSGTVISYPGHPTHSSHILRNRMLYGLTHRGTVLAALAGSMHEGDGLPDSALKRYEDVLEEGDDEVVRLLGAILALSEAVGDVRPMPRFRIVRRQLRVSLAPGAPVDPRLLARGSRWLRRSLDLEE